MIPHVFVRNQTISLNLLNILNTINQWLFKCRVPKMSIENLIKLTRQMSRLSYLNLSKNVMTQYVSSYCMYDFCIEYMIENIPNLYANKLYFSELNIQMCVMTYLSLLPQYFGAAVPIRMKEKEALNIDVEPFNYDAMPNWFVTINNKKQLRKPIKTLHIYSRLFCRKNTFLTFLRLLKKKDYFCNNFIIFLMQSYLFLILFMPLTKIKENLANFIESANIVSCIHNSDIKHLMNLVLMSVKIGKPAFRQQFNIPEYLYVVAHHENQKEEMVKKYSMENEGRSTISCTSYPLFFGFLGKLRSLMNILQPTEIKKYHNCKSICKKTLWCGKCRKTLYCGKHCQKYD